VGVVGAYEGDVGAYEGDVGAYEGDVGAYEGDVGSVCKDVVRPESCARSSASSDSSFFKVSVSDDRRTIVLGLDFGLGL